MKKIPLVFLIILTVSFSTMNGQEVHNMFNKKVNVVSNGSDIQQESAIVQVETLYFKSSGQATYSYDTVRELSELNTDGADAYPWISSDGLRIYYTRGMYENELYVAQRDNTTSYFNTPAEIPVSVPDAFSCWLSQDELDMYFSDRYNIYYAHRDSINSNFNTIVSINLSGIEPSRFKSGPSLNVAQDELFLY
ncbi:MAG: hypothetical protein U9R60_09250, partial [Bacteroidota bacterium]|nr:hypothetical protein [Bacteroidota bacterium]